jgi:outer membrane autotransporter protein
LEHVYALGLVGYAFDDDSTQRFINIGNIASIARGNFTGNELVSYLEGGVNVPVGGWTLQPLTALRYLLLAQNHFTEHDAGGADLSVGNQTANSLRYSLGMRLTRPFGSWAANWAPFLEARWAHETLNNQRLVDAQFVGAPGGSFVSSGSVLGRDFGEFGAGVSTKLGERIQLFAIYDAQVSSGQAAHGGTAGFQIAW